jgi:hypothetical protein
MLGYLPMKMVFSRVVALAEPSLTMQFQWQFCKDVPKNCIFRGSRLNRTTPRNGLVSSFHNRTAPENISAAIATKL